MKRIYIAGRPRSGKSTRAEQLRQKYEAAGKDVRVIHADDVVNEGHDWSDLPYQLARKVNRSTADVTIIEGCLTTRCLDKRLLTPGPNDEVRWHDKPHEKLTPKQETFGNQMRQRWDRIHPRLRRGKK